MDEQATINKRTVCEFWIRGLCMKGDTCGFLHEMIPDRMPICKAFRRNGFCNEAGCPFKHTLDDVKECNMYKLGFCIYGKACQFRHVKVQGQAPNIRSIEAAKPKGFRDEDVVRRQANPGWHGGGGGFGNRLLSRTATAPALPSHPAAHGQGPPPPPPPPPGRPGPAPDFHHRL